jgi:hypothetical protein
MSDKLTTTMAEALMEWQQTRYTEEQVDQRTLNALVRRDMVRVHVSTKVVKVLASGKKAADQYWSSED